MTTTEIVLSVLLGIFLVYLVAPLMIFVCVRAGRLGYLNAEFMFWSDLKRENHGGTEQAKSGQEAKESPVGRSMDGVASKD